MCACERWPLIKLTRWGILVRGWKWDGQFHTQQMSAAVTCCNSWTTLIGNGDCYGAGWTSGEGELKLVPGAVAKMDLMEVLLLGFKKGTGHGKYIWRLLKKERKECHSMTVSAVVSVMSTFSSSLCGFSLGIPWVWQSPEASSSLPLKQHGDSAPYSPLVTYNKKYDVRILFFLHCGLVCNSSNCLRSVKVIMSGGYSQERSIRLDRFASLSNSSVVAWTIAFIAVKFLVSTQSSNLQTGE